ncbi:MAG: DNA mismatch repair protein MutS [Bdellovibrionales bacterium]|nr:DNA mismatch repair protein MutS [Bdellovibrionales bacterium]
MPPLSPAQLSFDSIQPAPAPPEIESPEPGSEPVFDIHGRYDDLAPMLKQYVDYKRKYPEHLLLFQVGDFYEVFFSDSVTVAAALNIRLTSRDKTSDNPIPMCGVPIHALDNYLPKLLTAGYSCAIVSQVEAASKSRKGMVRRELTRIVTPGVRYEGDGLEESESNYLCAAVLAPRGSGAVCYVDVSCGRIRIAEVESENDLLEVVERVSPSELIIPSTRNRLRVPAHERWIRALKKQIKDNEAHVVKRPFDEAGIGDASKKLGPVATSGGSAKDLIQRISPEARSALSALMDYIEEVSSGTMPVFASCEVEQNAASVLVDAATRRSLELFEARMDGSRASSLLYHINMTKTSMGVRLLREWMQSPSCERSVIEARHAAVSELVSTEACSAIRNVLVGVRDVERVLSRITTGRASPRDLRLLSDSLAELPQVRQILSECSSELLSGFSREFDDLQDVYRKLSAALVDDPPVKISEGGIFREGYHEQLDELRLLASDTKTLLANLEHAERRRLGVSSGLKVKYNNVFGYFIEVTNSNIDKVPAHYERKQTLANAERFVTDELKELAVKILSARSRQFDIERELFSELRSFAAGQASRIQKTAQLLSQLDVISSFAELARVRNYVRPEFCDEPLTEIVRGRHPVVEGVIGAHNFVPNDLRLDTAENRFAVLTGPNMGGKSTYLRQAGIIQLLAQIGSFVPAESAMLGVVDRIFTRIGSGDDISRGESTFMVEMREMTTIVNRATRKSLVLIDEIGRGTATTDGLAIARAIAEWLHSEVGCRTIFATHFHELTDLEEQFEGAFCISVGVIEREEEGEVIFTHRIEKGAADRSYGIEVARLAGLPLELLDRASKLLDKTQTLAAAPASKKGSRSEKAVDRGPDYRRLAEEIRMCNLNNMTPLEALNSLAKLKELAEDSK